MHHYTTTLPTVQRRIMALPAPQFDNKSSKLVANKPHVAENSKPQQVQFVAYCKFCREGFKSESELVQHRRNHDRCPYEGCKFNANAKVVAEHIQRLHLKTNALVKIQDLTTPEQIEKWREERRKRYPTTANVQLRQQAREERCSRGERLQERATRFGDFQQRNHIRNMDSRNNKEGQFKKGQRNNKRDRRHNDKNPDDIKVQPALEQGVEPTVEAPETVKIIEKNSIKVQEPRKPFEVAKTIEENSSDDERATPRFKGTAHMKDYHEVETIVKEQAALSILGLYGSDSDDDTEDQEMPTISQTSPVAEQELSVVEIPIEDENIKEKSEILEEAPASLEQTEEHNDDDDNAPEELPISHEAVIPDSSQAPEKFTRKRKYENSHNGTDSKRKQRSVLDYSKLRSKPSVNPFLEKLLQDDIRHERNVLLQCVNYVVKNNFFGVGQPSKDESAIKSGDTVNKHEI